MVDMASPTVMFLANAHSRVMGSANVELGAVGSASTVVP